MTDPIHEQLSAFLDGELSAAESELLLKRVARDPELKALLERYVLAGEALRARELQPRPSRDFVAKVAAGIDAAPAARTRWRNAEWLKPVAGGMIAAGVAAVALVSVQTPTMTAANSPVETPVMVDVAATQATTAASDVAPSYVVPQALGPRPSPPIRVLNGGQLANYVVAHSEYSSPLGQRNVLSGLVAGNDQPGRSGVTVVEVNGQLYVVEQLPLDSVRGAPPTTPQADADAVLSRAPR